MGKVLGAILLLWLGVVVAVWYSPVPMTRTAGAAPVLETYDHACTFDEPGLKNCTDTAFYLWHLDAGRAVTTTWEPGRADIETLTGTLRHEDPRCRGSRVEWTVVADERISGTLTDDHPVAQLHHAVAEPLHRITITVRRLDDAPCATAVRWTDPRLAASFRLLPWQDA